jgi:hypothetical protein
MKPSYLFNYVPRLSYLLLNMSCNIYDHYDKLFYYNYNIIMVKMHTYHLVMTLTQDNNDDYLNDTTLCLWNGIKAKNLVESQFCSIMQT